MKLRGNFCIKYILCFNIIVLFLISGCTNSKTKTLPIKKNQDIQQNKNQDSQDTGNEKTIFNPNALNRIIAVVDEEPITLFDYFVEYKTKDIDPIRLNKLINNKLVLLEAQKLNIIVDSSRIEQGVEHYISQIKQNFKNDTEFILYLRTQGIEKLDDFKKQYIKTAKENYMISELLKRTLPKELIVTDENIARKYRVRIILSNNLELLKQVKEQLINGVLFEDLASEYSIDENTGENGGDLGEFYLGKYSFQIEKQILKTGLGLSDIFLTDFGFAILNVDYIKKADISDLSAEEKEKIRNRILDIKFAIEQEVYIKKLRKNAFIKILN